MRGGYGWVCAAIRACPIATRPRPQSTGPITCHLMDPPPPRPIASSISNKFYATHTLIKEIRRKRRSHRQIKWKTGLFLRKHWSFFNSKCEEYRATKVAVNHWPNNSSPLSDDLNITLTWPGSHLRNFWALTVGTISPPRITTRRDSGAHPAISPRTQHVISSLHAPSNDD